MSEEDRTAPDLAAPDGTAAAWTTPDPAAPDPAAPDRAEDDRAEDDGDDLMPELPVPPDAGPLPDAEEREARWQYLNRRAQLSVHPAEDARYTLYADHPAVRAELATLVAAEAADHPELEIAALVGDGHLVLAVRPLTPPPTALPGPPT